MFWSCLLRHKFYSKNVCNHIYMFVFCLIDGFKKICEYMQERV